MSKYTGVAISDFNAENFAGYINNDERGPEAEIQVAPFGQVAQILMNPQHEVWQGSPDFALVWTRPQGVIENFNRLLNYETVPLDDLLAEVDVYAAQILAMADRVKFAFVPTWVLPTYNKGLGMLDMRHGLGISSALMQMNVRLAEQLSAAPNIYMLNAQRWIESAGKNAFNPRLWYMAKVAFGNNVFKEAVEDVKSALSGISGQAKKLIIVDLDDTLWGGIVGDAGWENLALGGHDALGESFVHFQQTLKAFTRRGIVLGIVSKNEESVALEAIESHPEMVLRKDDFAGWRINWNDKAQNIIDLVEELNLGLQSVVFIDDNPVERARVREMLPEVFVPDWPQEKMLYTQALLSLPGFDNPTFSAEDAERTRMYVTERQRTELKKQVVSLDDWLATLGVEVKIEPLNEANLARTAQLLNKTNQLNLSTRRLTEAELHDWAAQEGHQLWTFRVGDKFGEQGLTGILSVDVQGSKAQVIDFILSCRVMGRKVEEAMVATAVDYARSLGLEEVYAVYLPTRKNKPCLDFWLRSGFDYREGENSFHWAADKAYPFPSQIRIESPEAVAS